MKKILAVGDCNTLGAGEQEKWSYPERLAARCNTAVRNYGLTMATSREGMAILSDNLKVDDDCVILQFGLVDSYRTFPFAPYVPYYPDSFWRKKYRGVVKKYKKISRKAGLCRKFGEVSVVPIEEYAENMYSMIEMVQGRITILPETIPNHQIERNSEIVRYNLKLHEVASAYSHVFVVPLYEDFLANMQEYFQDATHCNGAGYDFITTRISSALGF